MTYPKNNKIKNPFTYDESSYLLAIKKIETSHSITEKNAALISGLWIKINNEPDDEKRNKLIDILFNKDFVVHGHGNAKRVGVANVKKFLSRLYKMVKDYSLELEAIVSQDDIVAVRTKARGYRPGIFGSTPIAITTMLFFRFENSQIIEEWETMDLKAAVTQSLGLTNPQWYKK